MRFVPFFATCVFFVSSLSVLASPEMDLISAPTDPGARIAYWHPIGQAMAAYEKLAEMKDSAARKEQYELVTALIRKARKARAKGWEATWIASRAAAVVGNAKLAKSYQTLAEIDAPPPDRAKMRDLGARPAFALSERDAVSPSPSPDEFNQEVTKILESRAFTPSGPRESYRIECNRGKSYSCAMLGLYDFNHSDPGKATLFLAEICKRDEPLSCLFLALRELQNRNYPASCRWFTKACGKNTRQSACEMYDTMKQKRICP